ncbi:MAG TPA: AAA domain-containing protein [Oleiagrimonas sp.]|nr:AAA domain-containing protein [Oleiagrimonas sp.]
MATMPKPVRLVKYLRDLALLRSKTIRKVEEYERVLWLADFPRVDGCYLRAWQTSEPDNADIWMDVCARPEPLLPDVPEICGDWVDQTALRQTDREPKLKDHLQVPDDSKVAVAGDLLEHHASTSGLSLQNRPDVRAAWDDYVRDTWRPWATRHDEWSALHHVYTQLFALHQDQLRLGERFELVVGLGVLNWKPDGQVVRRHVVTTLASLEFDAENQRFSVQPHPAGGKLTLELDMVSPGQYSAHAVEIVSEALVKASGDPWDNSVIQSALEALVHSLAADGSFADGMDPPQGASPDSPHVQYAPALILRQRTDKGLVQTLERIGEQLGEVPPEAVPVAFARLAEADNDSPVERPVESHDTPSRTEPERIFFPKPSNDEQRRIIEQMHGSASVLVQGPPGTGKSHTIANLVSHLLATGQRILVTAKNPRALDVLKNLLPEPLQPLSINLLGSGAEERRSLESSVNGMLNKSQTWRADEANAERARLEDQLQQLQAAQAKIQRQLLDARAAETQSVSVAGGQYTGTPATIAKAIERDRADHDWFEDVAAGDDPCPVNADSLHKLRKALGYFSGEKRQELACAWPDELVPPQQFGGWVDAEEAASRSEAKWLPSADENVLEHLAEAPDAALASLDKALSALQMAVRDLDAQTHPWVARATIEVLSGRARTWQALQRATENRLKAVQPGLNLVDATRIRCPESLDLRDVFDDASVLHEHFADGGGWGWGPFRPEPVKDRLYIRNIDVNGHACRKPDQVEQLVEALRVRLEIERLWSTWKDHEPPREGTYAVQCEHLAEANHVLRDVLALKSLLVPCRAVTDKQSGLETFPWAEPTDRDRLHASIQVVRQRRIKQAQQGYFTQVEESLLALVDAGNPHAVVADLLAAVRQRNKESFAQRHCQWERLGREAENLQNVEVYLGHVQEKLPKLARTLLDSHADPIWDTRLTQLPAAWRWAQACSWLTRYFEQSDVSALGARSQQLSEDQHDCMTRLAANLAWSHFLSPMEGNTPRLNDTHRSHMQAWKLAMSKLGKGTGKSAPRWRRDAQQHLNACRETVPAWVMPLHRLWDTVSPKPGMFDVVIVDEASQCGFEGLPLFYLAKKLLIVGDDKQISPDAPGLKDDDVAELANKRLHDFRFKQHFGATTSLFDHGALQCGSSRITLREHFRCMPEIIGFSNAKFYSATPLLPMRQFGADRLPPLEHVFVPDGYREGTTSRVRNVPEADALVQRVVDMCRDARYDGKTMGVIALQGHGQSPYIETQLMEQLGVEVMEQRRIICGDPYSFQGDERDIMLLSMVTAAVDGHGQAVRNTALTKANYERRFNVAASRARDMMILFHSMRVDDLSPMCLRRKLLEYVTGTRPQEIAGYPRNELERRAAQDNRSVVGPPKPFDSWFEVDVALALIRRGYKVIPQYEFAGRRIDLVVDGGASLLAVECDGDHWHGPDQYAADMHRQRQLERCGWVFSRVRESLFEADRDAALAPVWSQLSALGIDPAQSDSSKDGEEVTTQAE